MMDFLLSHEEIRRILQSMGLVLARGFIPNEILTIDVLPKGTREHLAELAAIFFGLEPEAAARCDFDDWDDWAGFVHGQCRKSGLDALCFRTSGSTGQPKPCRLSFAELEEETASLKPHFVDCGRVVSVMPVHHVFGFIFALLLPKRLGIPVRQMPPLPTAEFFRELRDGDLLLAFPAFWKSVLLMHPLLNSALSKMNLRGVTSSAPCPADVILGLLGKGAMPKVLSRMTEIYGATEFGAVGIRHDCQRPYTLLPHWTRARLGGPAGDGEAQWGIQRAGGPACPLPDDVEWIGELSFLPLSRKDNAVQVGGVNVYPARVARLLLGHPKVKDCAVRLMRPEEGLRLKAFVVPDEAFICEEPAELGRELRDWLAERLEPAATPRAFTFGKALPLTMAGKPKDWAIRADQ